MPLHGGHRSVRHGVRTSYDRRTGREAGGIEDTMTAADPAHRPAAAASRDSAGPSGQRSPGPSTGPSIAPSTRRTGAFPLDRPGNWGVVAGPTSLLALAPTSEVQLLEIQQAPCLALSVADIYAACHRRSTQPRYGRFQSREEDADQGLA